MYIPTKIAKSYMLQHDRVLDHQNAVSKYYKQYIKLKKRNEELDKPKQNDKIFRDEVISWFFSLDLLTRLIVSSIENKWVTSLMHQLYIHQKREPTHKFQIKEEMLSIQNHANYGNEYCQQLLRLNINDSIYNSGNNQKNNFNSDDIFNYLRYFSSKDEIFSNSNNYTQSNNVTSNKNLNNIHELFLKELKFYKSEELIFGLHSENIEKYSNYFTLSETLLKDEKLFKLYFDELSNYQAFTHLIPASFEHTSKNYHLYLPDWIKSNEFYSVAEFFVAFFEQVITVKYILHKQNQTIPKVKSHLQSIIDESKELVDFMKKFEKIGATVFKLVKEMNLVEDVFQDSIIQEFVMNRIHQNNNSASSILTTQQNFNNDIIFNKEKLSSSEIEIKLKEFLLKYDEVDQPSPEKLVNEFVYFGLDKIFSYDDFLFRKIYECLIQYRQKESYEDLINDSINLQDNLMNLNNKNNGKINKRKKKKYSFTINNTKTQIKESNNNLEYKVEPVLNKLESNNLNNSDRKEIIIKLDEENEIRDIVKSILEEMLLHISGSNSFHDYYEANLQNNSTYSNLIDYGKRNYVISVDNNNCNSEFEFRKNSGTSNDSHININNDKILPLLFCREIDTNNKKPENVEVVQKKREIFKINPDLNSNESLTPPDKKILSPCFSEVNENNDTDTAYSSEDYLSGSKKGKEKKKRKTKKFFLYDVSMTKKAHKKPESKYTSMNSNQNKNKTESINQIKENNQLKIDEKKSFTSPIFSNIGNISIKGNNNYIDNPSEKKINQTNVKVFKNDNKYDCNINNSYPVNYNNKNRTYNKDHNNDFINYDNASNSYQKRISKDYYSKKSKFQNGNTYENNNKNKYRNSYVRSHIEEIIPIGSCNPNPYQFISFNNFPFNTYAPCQIFNGVNDFYISHNPINFEYFNLTLHKDIVDYNQVTENILMILRPFKVLVITYLEKQIKDFFSNYDYNLNARIEVYGSFVSELDIECSDIDMTISLEENGTDSMNMLEYEYVSIMTKLTEYLNKLNVFQNVNPIYSASVPVIKLAIETNSVLDNENKEKLYEFTNSDLYKSYNFKKEELELIKIDLTLLDLIKIRNKTQKNIPQSHVSYVKTSCLIYPEIKPIAKILKRYLQLHNLNNTFNGGLSSFSLFLLILAYVKIHRFKVNNGNINLGKLFIEFILYYGNFIDFNFTIIDVNMDNPFVIYPHPIEALPYIVDPISYNNVGKSSYMFLEIIQLFNLCYNDLNKIKMMLEMNQCKSKENIVNLIFRNSKK